MAGKEILFGNEARTVAVVVPSPALSAVFWATSFTS